MMKTGLHVYTTNFTCRDTLPPGLLVFKDVSAPVGALEDLAPVHGHRRHGNLHKDVRRVQELLNGVSAAQGGQCNTQGGKGLVEDGLIGPRTRAAIHRFQTQQFPTKYADSVVEPSKRTIYRLNELDFPGVDAALLAKSRHSLGQVTNCIQCARNLVGIYRLERGLPAPLFTTHRAQRLLNYHFHLDQSTDAVRDLAFIAATLQMMHTVVAHAVRNPYGKTAFGYIDINQAAAEDIDCVAVTAAGGYHMPGMTLAEEAARYHLKVRRQRLRKLRVDMIYLTRRLINRPPGVIVVAIIHELAHFVGGGPGDTYHIRDRAYYRHEKARYEKLTTYEAITNAECYGQFCWQAEYRSHFPPSPEQGNN